jgi:hypothetical protein
LRERSKRQIKTRPSLEGRRETPFGISGRGKEERGLSPSIKKRRFEGEKKAKRPPLERENNFSPLSGREQKRRREGGEKGSW